MKKDEVREMLYAVDSARRRMMKPYFLKIGLTIGQGQPRILRYLYEREPMTQRELADACHLDAATMSRTLDRLEEAGLLCRTPKPGCRRSYHIMLTDAGRAKAQQVVRGFQTVDDAIWKGIPENEMKPMLDTLKKVCANLESAEKEMERIEFDTEK